MVPATVMSAPQLEQWAMPLSTDRCSRGVPVLNMLFLWASVSHSFSECGIFVKQLAVAVLGLEAVSSLGVLSGVRAVSFVW